MSYTTRTPRPQRLVLLAATIGLGAASVLLPNSAFAAPGTGHTTRTPTVIPAEAPPQSYCIYRLELNQPWLLGHCEGYEAGEAAGENAGARCWPMTWPKFPPYGEGNYGKGYRVGYPLAYKYYYNKAWKQAGCQHPLFKPFKNATLMRP